MYKKDQYGFRGRKTGTTKEINFLTVGGSTTDERYKPENLTITGFLNKKFKEDKIDIKITNAGIEGQSTFGHIYNFQNWFPKLKGFNPDYFIPQF